MGNMAANKLLSKRQYGFICGRSTVLQLLKVLDAWSHILDSGGQIGVIYIDYMKAFDQVLHQRLLSKVKSYGIGGSLLELIQDFMCHDWTHSSGERQRFLL